MKAVADLVWSKLTGVFTKDLHHAQVLNCHCISMPCYVHVS